MDIGVRPNFNTFPNGLGFGSRFRWCGRERTAVLQPRTVALLLGPEWLKLAGSVSSGALHIAVIPQQLHGGGERQVWPSKRRPRRQPVRLNRVDISRPTPVEADAEKRRVSG